MKQNVLLVRNHNMLANIILFCVCALTSSISVMTRVCAHKPSTLPSSHTNMRCGSTLIANECMSCYKVWPLVTKTTCCSADVYTVDSQQRNQSFNQPCLVSVSPLLSHTHSNRGELQSSASGKDFSSRRDGSARWVIWPRRTRGATLKSDSPHRPTILDGFTFQGQKKIKPHLLTQKRNSLKWF